MILVGKALMLGKVAMLMVTRKKQQAGQEQSQIVYQELESKEVKVLNKSSLLIYERYPIGLWCLGYSATIFGLINSGLMLMHRHIFKDEMEEGTYMRQLALYIVVLLIGLVMLFIAKKERLRINKEEDFIYVEYKNIFCVKHLEGRRLKSLKNILIVKKGIQTFNENTLHYVIRFEFSDDFEDLEVAESRKLSDIKSKYFNICSYLDQSVDTSESFRLLDESKSSLKWKFKKPQLPQINMREPSPPSPRETKVNQESIKQRILSRLRRKKIFTLNDD